MRDRIARFQAWKDASLLRRVVVTVAAFVMLSCFSIGTLSLAAITATRAVFKPTESTVQGSSSAVAANDATNGIDTGAPKSGASSKKGGPRAQRSTSAEKPGESE